MLNIQKVISYKNQTLIEIAKVSGPFRHQVYFENETCLTFFFDAAVDVYESKGVIKKQGNFYLLQRCGNVIVDYKSYKSNFFSTRVIAFHFHPSIVSSILEKNSYLFEGVVSNIASNELLDSILLNFFNHLITLIEQKKVLDDSIFTIKYIELLLYLYKSSKSNLISKFSEYLFDKKEIDFRNFIESYKYIKISQKELAALYNISLSNFKRKFFLIYNQPPGQYFKRKKLEKAKELLKKNELNISEIIQKIGYDNLSHFSKGFKELNGITPKEYRMSQKR